MSKRSEAICEAFKLAVRASSWEVMSTTKFLLLIQTAMDRMASGMHAARRMTTPSCSRMPMRIVRPCLDSSCPPSTPGRSQVGWRPVTNLDTCSSGFPENQPRGLRVQLSEGLRGVKASARMRMRVVRRREEGELWCCRGWPETLVGWSGGQCPIKKDDRTSIPCFVLLPTSDTDTRLCTAARFDGLYIDVDRFSATDTVYILPTVQIRAGARAAAQVRCWPVRYVSDSTPATLVVR